MQRKKKQFWVSEQWKRAKRKQASKQTQRLPGERRPASDSTHSTTLTLLWLFSTFYSNGHQNWRLIAKINLKIIIFILSMKTRSLLKRRKSQDEWQIIFSIVLFFYFFLWKLSISDFFIWCFHCEHCAMFLKQKMVHSYWKLFVELRSIYLGFRLQLFEFDTMLWISKWFL